MCKGPSPGGEPLWRGSGHPRNSRLIASKAETCGKKRLPETTQRDAFARSRRFVLHPTNRAVSRWVIRGSRLSTVPAMRRNSRGGRAHAKSAPLQSSRTNTPYQGAASWPSDEAVFTRTRTRTKTLSVKFRRFPLVPEPRPWLLCLQPEGRILLGRRKAWRTDDSESEQQPWGEGIRPLWLRLLAPS
jgi:hypothetical protein